MVLELHVWGPAFSLPSIDPQCLAAVAYVAQTVSRDQWVLIAGSEDAAGPAKELPALKDGGSTITGYDNLISYLSERKGGEHDLDAELNAPRRADATAFSSHLQAHALPLLDLSLYVSSQNYTTITRSAWTPVLPWLSPYTIPPARRSLAKQRTQYLGLLALEVDSSAKEQDKHANVIPDRLRTVGKPTVTGLVKKEQTTTRFRLDALVDAAFEPLSRLLGDKKYFLSDSHSSSLDCLALGYLSLALIPQLPQPWLREGLRQRFPNLCAFVSRGIRDVYGGTITVEAALSPSPRTKEGLPWQPPAPQSASTKATALLSSLIPSSPFSNPSIRTAGPQSTTNKPANALGTSMLLPAAAATVVATIAAMGAYVFFPELLSLASPYDQERSLGDMGEAGEMFRGLDLGRRDGERGNESVLGEDRGKGLPVAEVHVEVKKDD